MSSTTEEPAKRRAFQVPPGDESETANAAACTDAIRETQRKHELELAALRAHYEAQLGELRSTCKPCANGPPASNPEPGVASIPKGPTARTTACALWAIFSSERVCIRIRGPPTFDRDPGRVTISANCAAPSAPQRRSPSPGQPLHITSWTGVATRLPRGRGRAHQEQDNLSARRALFV